MANATTATGPVSKAKIRMYRAGTGDFFLLQFSGADDKKFNMMIDCGCIKGRKELFSPLVKDLASETDGVIDLLVVTHQHDDHINGFQKSADLFMNISFKKVWFAWTEDESDPVANDYRKNYSELDKALHAAVQRLEKVSADGVFEKMYANEAGRELMINGKKNFIQAVAQIAGLNECSLAAKEGEPKPTMVTLLENYHVIKEDTVVEFLEPGDVRADLPGAAGISFFVLGPPRSRAFLNRTEKEGATYEQRKEKSKVDFSLVSVLSAAPGMAGTAQMPFEKSYAEQDTVETEAVKMNYNDGGDWRKIDHDWLFSAGSLAMRYERSINNTSLALAIQFQKSEKVLLFPGDAELGNWESWHDGLDWPVKINGSIVRKTAEYFLNKTVFYKVGHHLSQNGTAMVKGIEMMTSGDLTAMATLDFRKINDGWLNTMPNDLLGAELIKKTRGKLFFAGERDKILRNIQTNRVSIKKVHQEALEELNAAFDGKFYIDYEIEG